MNEEQRIEYLLGPWSSEEFMSEDRSWTDFLSLHDRSDHWKSHIAEDGQLLHQGPFGNKRSDIYLDAFTEMLRDIIDTDRAPHCTRESSTEMIVINGDSFDPSQSFPMFAKSRGLGGGNILVQGMEKQRHWGWACSLEDRHEWEDKKVGAVWRGGPTGFSRDYTQFDLIPRVAFVKQYFDFDPKESKIDVGFNKLSQGLEQELKDFVKPKMDREEMLKHKFVISIQGNDVATNLKWIVASNSVPFMPKPTVESWFLEGTLVAGEHYVELVWTEGAGWDLEEKIQFCIENDAKCKEIALNGKRFMEHYRFCDGEYQRELEAKVVDRYCEQVTLQIN